MKVQIEDKLYIESDTMQYTIKEYTGKTSKEGAELFKTHGYFSNLSGAVQKLVKMKLHESTATTLKELLEDVKRIEQYIESKVTV